MDDMLDLLEKFYNDPDIIKDGKVEWVDVFHKVGNANLTDQICAGLSEYYSLEVWYLGRLFDFD